MAAIICARLRASHRLASVSGRWWECGISRPGQQGHSWLPDKLAAQLHSMSPSAEHARIAAVGRVQPTQQVVACSHRTCEVGRITQQQLWHNQEHHHQQQQQQQQQLEADLQARCPAAGRRPGRWQAEWRPHSAAELPPGPAKPQQEQGCPGPTARPGMWAGHLAPGWDGASA